MLAGGVSIVHFHGVALCVFVSLSFCVLCVCPALCNCVKPRKGKLGFYQHCHLISFYRTQVSLGSGLWVPVYIHTYETL